MLIFLFFHFFFSTGDGNQWNETQWGSLFERYFKYGKKASLKRKKFLYGRPAPHPIIWPKENDRIPLLVL